MSRVLLMNLHSDEEKALESSDLDFVSCGEDESAVEQVAVQRPDVVVYELRPDSDSDLAVLRLLRRVAPRVTLVVLGERDQLAWETPPDLRPLFRAPLPLGREALADQVKDALSSRH